MKTEKKDLTPNQFNRGLLNALRQAVRAWTKEPVWMQAGFLLAMIEGSTAIDKGVIDRWLAGGSEAELHREMLRRIVVARELLKVIAVCEKQFPTAPEATSPGAGTHGPPPESPSRQAS